jgi:hypothetical protein
MLNFRELENRPTEVALISVRTWTPTEVSADRVALCQVKFETTAMWPSAAPPLVAAPLSSLGVAAPRLGHPWEVIFLGAAASERRPSSTRAALPAPHRSALFSCSNFRRICTHES